MHAADSDQQEPATTPEPSASKSDAMALPAHVRDALPATVKTEISKLSMERQEAFVEEFDRKAKSTGTAYLLWLVSLHYAYFGDWTKQVLYWFTFGGLIIWMVADAIRMGDLVQEYNRNVAAEVMRDIKLMSM